MFAPDIGLAIARAMLLKAKLEPRRPQSRVHYRRIPMFRAGRNQPCPCGKPKKFKNCCIHEVKIIVVSL